MRLSTSLSIFSIHITGQAYLKQQLLENWIKIHIPIVMRDHTFKMNRSLRLVLLLSCISGLGQAATENSNGGGTIKDEFILALIFAGGSLVIIAFALFLRSQKCCRCFNCFRFRRSFYLFNKKHSQPVTSLLSQEDFENRKNRLIEIMNSTESRQSFLVKMQKGEKIVSHCHIVKAKKKKPFFYQILLDGHDEIGTFQGKGAILVEERGLFMWFFKEYDHHVNAYKRSAFKDMIFRTFKVKNDEVRGWWHYADVAGSGEWRISDHFVQNLETEEILAPTKN